jgi:long-subunit fatty acid transport protein
MTRTRNAKSDPNPPRKNPKEKETKAADAFQGRYSTRSSRHRWLSVLVLLATPLFLVPHSEAQNINDALVLEDLGFTSRLAVAARPAGMAGAYIAAADDVHALVYNPAGLARVRRIDLSLGFQYNDDRVTNLFYGNSNETSSSSMALDAVAAAYPVPTYRGSLVIAGGVYRIMTSQFDLLNRSFNTKTDTEDDYRLQQSGSAYSYNLGAGLDVGPMISIGANGFILDGTLNVLTQSSYEFRPPFEPGDLESEWFRDDVEADLNGYGLSLGIQYHPYQQLHAGLVVTTPIHLEHKGTAIFDSASYFYNDEDSIGREDYVIEMDYTIPFRIDAGVSFTLPSLTVSLDAGYSDWGQAEVNGFELKDENLAAIFRQVVDVRLGAEYVLPVAPVRLRAGYARTPYPLDYLQADRITQNDLQKAKVDTERHTLAAGFGVLLDRVLTIDASFEYQTGKRSISTLVDERSSRRVVLTTSYRF